MQIKIFDREYLVGWSEYWHGFKLGVEASKLNFWDWGAGNAAIMGGIFSGLASGVAAYYIFSKGLKSEQERHRLEEEKLAAERAFRAFHKMRNWYECGLKIGVAVEQAIDNSKAEVQRGLPTPMVVRAFLDSLPTPERIEVSEVSFLSTRNSEGLLDSVFDLESWGHHLLTLSQRYSVMREKWAEWSMANSEKTHLINGEDGVTTSFSPEKAPHAKIRVAEMEGLINGIMHDFSKTAALHRETIQAYINECLEAFPNNFPKLEIDWNDEYAKPVIIKTSFRGRKDSVGNNGSLSETIISTGWHRV